MCVTGSPRAPAEALPAELTRRPDAGGMPRRHGSTLGRLRLGGEGEVRGELGNNQRQSFAPGHCREPRSGLGQLPPRA